MLTGLLQVALSTVAGATGRALAINNHNLDTAELSRQLDTLSRCFEFRSIDELRPAGRGAKPPLALTFDDGKRICATEIAPLLQRRGIPAAFYIVTDHADTGEPLWFDRYAALKRRSPERCRAVLGANPKHLSHDELMARLASLQSELGVEPSLDDPTVALMSWREIEHLDESGFDIGAHTRAHEIVTRLEPQAAQQTIEASIQAVSDRLGKPCRTFAFPNGNHNPALVRFVRSLGVHTCFTTDPRWIARSDPPWCLPRVQLHSRFTERQILAKLLSAAPGCLLANPDGSGRRYVFSRAGTGEL